MGETEGQGKHACLLCHCTNAGESHNVKVTI
jgi:hypothetical protein